jgi:hypothetical protein
MPGVQGKGPPFALNTQLSASEVSEGYSIRFPLITFILVRRRGIAVVDCDPIPRDRDMSGGKVQQKLPETGTHPGVPGEVRAIAPAPNHSEGLTPTLSCLDSIVIDWDDLPAQLCKKWQEDSRI